jgi:5-formyltetrahydrofolate cyclo-ligase
MEINQKKNLIRKKISKKLACLSNHFIKNSSEKLYSNFEKNIFPIHFKNIAAFYPTPLEIQIQPILYKILDSKKKLFLPFIEKSNLFFSHIKDLRLLDKGKFNILEPRTKRKKMLHDIEILLVPGLAFDLNGNRLGHGKGFYDRLLPLLNPKCLIYGVCYDFQIFPEIPVLSYDIPIQFILSEKRIVNC